MKKRLAILGSTGSVGVNALRVVSKLKSHFEITALSADTNIRLLSEQASVFKPRIVSVGREDLCGKIRPSLAGKIKCVSGPDGLREIVTRKDVDMVLFAISGSACLKPLIEAIEHKKGVALANKESLVSAGPIIMKLAKRNAVTIIPVDSEHNAVFQCLDGGRGRPRKIYLTGSGGPLLNIRKEKFDALSLSFILKHPKWKMGRKISVDSATMMNKGLEIIEAEHLFEVNQDQIEVLVHPEAIVHSMVEFLDGSILAQLATPDMRLPIQYALTYPDRIPGGFESVSLAKVGKLRFSAPDLSRFPCLRLAREAASEGGTAPAVLCASDEEAVKYFLSGAIKFSDIAKVIEKVLSRHRNAPGDCHSVSAILEKEAWAREEARSICSL